jgi:hypothetical protein
VYSSGGTLKSDTLYIKKINIIIIILQLIKNYTLHYTLHYKKRETKREKHNRNNCHDSGGCPPMPPGGVGGVAYRYVVEIFLSPFSNIYNNGEYNIYKKTT